jgi:hypothetical protein
MTPVQQIASQITALPEPDMRQFRKWFDQFDAQNWEKAIDNDVVSGKLDSLAAEALAQYSAGKCKPL